MDMVLNIARTFTVNTRDDNIDQFINEIVAAIKDGRSIAPIRDGTTGRWTFPFEEYYSLEVEEYYSLEDQPYEGMLSVPEGWSFDAASGIARGRSATHVLTIVRDERRLRAIRDQGSVAEFLFNDGSVGEVVSFGGSSHFRDTAWINGDVFIRTSYRTAATEEMIAIARTLTDPLRASLDDASDTPQNVAQATDEGWRAISDGLSTEVEIPVAWTYEIVDNFGMVELVLTNEDGSISLFVGYIIAGDPQVFIDESDSQPFYFGDGITGYMIETPNAIMWVPAMGGWPSCCGINFYHGGNRVLFERNEDVLLRIARSLRSS